MTDSKIRPGALVRDNRSRVGKVVGAIEDVVVNGEPVTVVTVDFWGVEVKRPENWLTPLDGNSPEALLLDRPAELAAWAEFAPLRLVALALSVDGGTGKVADIREKLDERVPGIKWDGWWRKAPPQMRQLPDHFRITKVGKDSEYSLLSSVEAIPAETALKSVKEPERNSATPTDWKNWLQAATHRSAPGRFPPKSTSDTLAAWPAQSIEQALLRVIVSAEEALGSRSINAQTAEGWLRAVAQASLRWREVGGSDPRGYTAARVGEVIGRLARTAGDRAPQDLLLQAGAIDGDTDAWRRGFLAGMWESFEGDDARDLYLGSAAVLGRQARGDLAREIALAAFGPELPERRHTEIDRLLDALPEGERLQTLEELMARASAAQRGEVQEFITRSRHAQGAERLPLRIAAALLLSGGRGDFSERTSRELAAALEEPQGYGATIQTVLGPAAAKVEFAGFSASAEVQKRSAEAQAEIEREREEQERLRQQVRERNAELAANREESRLEIRQDMLLAVGEVLQSVYKTPGSEAMAGTVAAGLTLALRAGGAEPLETPDEIVNFDPELHDSEGSVPPRASVRVIAPGVIYRGGIHGDRVLLKAKVKHEAG